MDFDRRVRLEFRGSQFSSDGGLLVTSHVRSRRFNSMPSERPKNGEPDKEKASPAGMLDEALVGDIYNLCLTVAYLCGGMKA